MSVHVLPPENVDYRRMFHKRAMKARLAMAMAARRQQEIERLRAEKEARDRYHASKGRTIYLFPIGPMRAPVQRDVLLLGSSVKPNRIHQIKRIQVDVCMRAGISRTDILSHRRTASIAFVRQFAMWRCKQETRCSLPEIGRRFDGRDHTTVLHAIRKMDALYAARDPRIMALLPEEGME